MGKEILIFDSSWSIAFEIQVFPTGHDETLATGMISAFNV